MKLYSDTLTSRDVYGAFWDARTIDGADIWPEDVREFKPRKHARGVQFYAYSHGGNRATGHRPVGSYPLDEVNRAASWDAYGYVIARLFMKDPKATIGMYKGVSDFVRSVESNGLRREPKDFLRLVEEV